MEAIECMKTRRSIRKFKPGAVDKETLTKIVEAAAMTPSWKNTQITRYHIVQNKDLLNRMVAECFPGFAHNQEIVGGADNLVVVSMVTGRCGYERDGSFTTKKGDRWQMFDAGGAANTFCLAAHAYGIGTVILGIFDEDKVAECIDLPEGQQVAALIAMGYADEEPKTPPKKTVDVLMDVI